METEQNISFSVPLSIIYKNGEKAIELRKTTSNTQLIKILIYCAMHDQPVLIFPAFTDKLRAICRLQEEGILEMDKESGKYYFLI